MLEAIVVGLIVIAAVAYAAWALLPAATRLRAAAGFNRWAGKPGRPSVLRRAAAAFERAARARMGGCSDCSAVQDAPRPPADSRPDRPRTDHDSSRS
jgi:hypothetical protein